ncbi:peptidase M42 [Tepiditoga spiralis]|uniref:Peptidase M42 n=1 Tax=Tepiditoga spiralis TaxID=2108365 RepID=A0A7G1G1Z2_9BACT|nr:M42 family metallopeptidase [Tepiditoga spiralis]BBE30311.1 peptidase M42 [Tepiditoga spiralis]
MKIDMEYTLNYLKEIMKVHSPSGDTEKGIKNVEEEFDKLKISHKRTKKGAIIATIKGKDDEHHKTISAHIDTLGAMVKEIKNNGRLKMAQIGGFSWTSVEGENVIVKTLNGEEYTGTILFDKQSVHIHGMIPRETIRSDENMEIRLDEDVKNKDDVLKLGINVGDFVYCETRTTITKNGYIKSRYLDDKAAVAIIMGICKYIKDNNIEPKYTTHFFISNYEEVGHGISAIPEKTDEFIAIDIGTVGLGQNSDEFSVCISARDTSGPYDFSFRKKLQKICEKNNIQYKVDMYNRYGSDASKLVHQGVDVNYALLGPGVDATHHYERTHIKSLDNTAKLLLNYIV